MNAPPLLPGDIRQMGKTGRTEYRMGQGDRVVVDEATGLELVCTHMRNSLCPSHYDKGIVCFWSGQLIGTFHVQDTRHTVDVAPFMFTTHSEMSPRLVARIGGKNYYVWSTGNYDAGETRDDAQMNIFVFWRERAKVVPTGTKTFGLL